MHRPDFRNHLFYAISRGSTDYQLLTLVAIAGAIHGARVSNDYKASVFIDGLKRKEERPISTRLHRIGVHTEKVRGVTDQSSPLIRLADAVAGLVREAEEGKPYAVEILKRLTTTKVLSEV